MVNFKKLADRATQAREAIDKQGGPEVLKAKAERMGRIAKGEGSVADRAKAAASVAREKPNPASDSAARTQAAGDPEPAAAEPPARAEPTEL